MQFFTTPEAESLKAAGDASGALTGLKELKVTAEN